MWTFHESVPESRRQQLGAWHSFENVVGALMLAADVVGFAWEPFRGPELKRCYRAEFLLRVPPHVYDGFFNSPVGYRAQYAVSADHGRCRNRDLIDALKTKLLAYSGSIEGVRLADVQRSIEGTDAKVWIHEKEVERHYFDESPEIDFAPWSENSEDGAGLRAPLGTELLVCGGWIDNSGQERLNPHKATRSKDIHEVGFS